MLIESLTPEEARVLGALIEKSLSTPDYYPLTLNSLRTACNQKSSRDPVTEYNDETVMQALTGLKRKVLVTFIPYGSQGSNYKFRHFLEDPRFNMNKPEIAVFAALLLRGAQTLNEIKLRASSMVPLDSLEEAEAALNRLANREEPLAQLLQKRPGWKEPRWRDLVREVARDFARDLVREPTEEVPAKGNENGLTQIGPVRMDEIETLKHQVEDLRNEFSELKILVMRIKTELGVQ